MAQPPFPDTPAPHLAQGWFHLFFLSSGSGAGGAAPAGPQNHLLHPPLVQRWGGGYLAPACIQWEATSVSVSLTCSQ